MSSAGLTIHDVASRANVSVSTVSNVLNGRRERMRAETCERVLRAMSDLGYAPNQMARGLKGGFVPTIGLIVPSVANPFWGAFAREVENAAAARGCQVLLCNGERNPDRERQYAESLLARGIRGVILGSAPISMNHLVGLVRRGLHVVTFDRDSAAADGVEFDSVRVDNAAAAHAAVTHLLHLGHRRIAFVSGPISSSCRRDRLNGYHAALRDAGVAADPALVWTEPVTPAGTDEEGTVVGRTAALALLARADRPTACFAINDMTAFGLYAGARSLGMSIPDDLAVVGFDNLRLCEVVTPPLTSVRQPLEQLMPAALALLVNRLERKHNGPAEHITVPAELVVRGSTAPMPRQMAAGG